MAKHYPMYLGGKWVTRKNRIRVENPYDDSLVGTVSAASKDDFTRAITLAEAAFAETRNLPAYQRERTCLQIANGIEKNFDKFAKLMCRELGKSLKDSRLEIGRAIGVSTVVRAVGTLVATQIYVNAGFGSLMTAATALGVLAIVLAVFVMTEPGE